MGQSRNFGRRGSFLQSTASLEEASARYAHLYHGAKTEVASGRWEEATLAPEGPAEELGGARATRPGSPPSAPCVSSSGAQGASGIPGRPRGFANRSDSDNGDIPNTGLFAIATSQVLLSLGSILGFLRRHSSARRDAPSSGTDEDGCYACAMAGAFYLVYSGERAPNFPEAHSSWSGRPWEMPHPDFPRPLRRRFRQTRSSQRRSILNISHPSESDRSPSYSSESAHCRGEVVGLAGLHTGRGLFLSSTRWYLFRPRSVANSRFGSPWEGWR